ELSNLNRNYSDVKNRLTDAESQIDKKALEELEKIGELEDIDELLKKAEEVKLKTDEVRATTENYESTLEEYLEKMDEWESDKEHYEELLRIQEEEQKFFELIGKTKKHLETAKEALVAKYTDPIMSAFKEYYSFISGNATDTLHMDSNIRVTYEEKGLQRDVETLSVGYKDLMGVCLRFALADAMYENEKPMIICDDPFTNLDDEKMESAKKLLEKIAQKYQVIYLTCSKTR
ncbi:MAG: hypothetical protein K6F37_08595, partial [Lachnospiraceae bacterium]|nr:hypothetical protein [Lachnospiraceae bacterium]